MKIRANVKISGRVIMVGFRAACEAKADEFGITGWIKNQVESWPVIGKGEIEAVFEGEKDNVYELVYWCKKGSTLAHIDKIDVEYSKATGEFADFSIKY